MYIVSFLIMGFVGWVWERKILKKEGSTGKIWDGYPFLTIYAFSGPFFVYMHTLTCGWSVWLAAFVCAVVITLYECGSGHLDNVIREGNPTWRYDTCSFCDGYASIPASLFWMMGSLVILCIMKKCLYQPKSSSQHT